MKFGDIYCSNSDKDLEKNKNKIILTDDAYSLAEAIHRLVDVIERSK